MKSVKRWLVTTNHKDVGILYITTSLFFLIFGGVLALLFRAHLWESGGLQFGGSALLSNDQYYQSVSAHGLIMVFWFLSRSRAGLRTTSFHCRSVRKTSRSATERHELLVLPVLGHPHGNLVLPRRHVRRRLDDVCPLNVPTYTPAIGATSGSNATILAHLTLFVVSITLGSVNFLVTMHRSRAGDSASGTCRCSPGRGC